MHALPASWRGPASVFGARFAGIFLGAGLVIMAARLLGPGGQGNYATLAAGVDLGSQITNLGVSSALLVLLSKQPWRVSFAQKKLWWLALGWVIALAALYPAARLVFPDAADARSWWTVLVVWIPLKLIRLDQVAMLTALKAYSAISRLELGGRIIGVGLGLCALFFFRQPLAYFVAALVLADLLIAMMGAATVSRVSPPPTGDGVSDRDFLISAGRLALKAFPVLLLPWILVRSDLLLVRAFLGSAQAGLYSIAAQLIDIGFLLPSTLAGFLVPTLAREGGTAEGLLRLCRRVGGALLGCSIVALLVGRPLLGFLLGSAYLGSYDALVLLLPGFIALSLETLLVHHFALQGFPSFLVRFWLVAVVLNVSFNILLIPRFGIQAAAATSSIAYTLVFVLVSGRFLRETGLPWSRLIVAGRR